MPIQAKQSGRVRTLVKDLFTKHEDHKLAQLNSPVFVNPEPIGQDVTDAGDLVPIFEAVVLEGELEGSVFNVAEGELNLPIVPDECDCLCDDNGCVVIPMETCKIHKSLTHRLAGGEGL